MSEHVQTTSELIDDDEEALEKAKRIEMRNAMIQIEQSRKERKKILAENLEKKRELEKLKEESGEWIEHNLENKIPITVNDNIYHHCEKKNIIRFCLQTFCQ